MNWRPLLVLGWLLFCLMLGLSLDRETQPGVIDAAAETLIETPSPTEGMVRAVPHDIDRTIFRGVQHRHYQVRVRFVPHKTDASLVAAFKWAHGIDMKEGELRGFKYIDTNGVCVIHMVDPEVDWQPAILGHEFAHCLYGMWHGVLIK